MDNPENWQVWVRYKSKRKVEKKGDPVSQDEAMKQLEPLLTDPRVAVAYIKECT